MRLVLRTMTSYLGFSALLLIGLGLYGLITKGVWWGPLLGVPVFLLAMVVQYEDDSWMERKHYERLAELGDEQRARRDDDGDLT